MSSAKTKAAKPGAQLPKGNYTPHILSQLVPGEMTKEEFDALCIDIKANGMQHAITLFEGQILDGRHRHQALAELKMPYNPKNYVEFKGTQAEASAFAYANALHRRQLNSMQKGMVAARMCLIKVNPPTQKEAAARVGVGLQIVNLAVRLINSNNTPLIKRTENGEASRAEIDELLYDRTVATVEKVEPVTAGLGDEEEGDDLALGSAPGKVAKISDHKDYKAGSTVGKRAQVPERRASETPVSRVVQHFKGLSEKDRIQFVLLGWTWLKPAFDKAEAERAKQTREGGKPLAGAPKVGKRAFAKAVKASAPKAQPVVSKAGKAAAAKAKKAA